MYTSTTDSDKRKILYKHGEDLKQEMVAIQFIDLCSALLRSSGLDLKIKTFRCLPTGAKRGFIEWVPNTVPLSKICSNEESDIVNGTRQAYDDILIEELRALGVCGQSIDSSPLEMSLLEEPVYVSHGNSKSTSPKTLQRLPKVDTCGSRLHTPVHTSRTTGLPLFHSPGFSAGTSSNPVQDYLRRNAYDADAPFLVRRDVLDTYVKSCAGYCVITYLLVSFVAAISFTKIHHEDLNSFCFYNCAISILSHQGVGDRHLDNILLDKDGHLLHCDFSFILGQDPKTYIPLR